MKQAFGIDPVFVAEYQSGDKAVVRAITGQEHGYHVCRGAESGGSAQVAGIAHGIKPCGQIANCELAGVSGLGIETAQYGIAALRRDC